MAISTHVCASGRAVGYSQQGYHEEEDRLGCGKLTGISADSSPKKTNSCMLLLVKGSLPTNLLAMDRPSLPLPFLP